MMLKKAIVFLSDHAFMVMMLGFFLALVGLIFFMQTRFAGTIVPRISFGVTIAGFAIYVIGRVLVSVQRRKSRRERVEQTLPGQKDQA